MRGLSRAISVAALLAVAASPAWSGVFGYVADYNNDQVLVLDSNGTVTPLASVFAASGAALDSSGNLYVGSGTDIVKITPGGSTTTFASKSSVTFEGQLAFDASGNLFAASQWDSLVYKITTGGVISTYLSGFALLPEAVAFDTAGNLFISLYDSNDPTPSDVGGSEVVEFLVGGLGPFASGLNTANGLAFGASGDLYVSSANSHLIYKITTGGVVSTFANDPRLNGPVSIAFDAAGNLYSANYFDGSISKISPAGAVVTFGSTGLGQGAFGIALVRFADADGDGVPDSVDNCPTVANTDQADGDADGVGDACDNCVDVSNPRVTPDVSTYLGTNPWATLTGGQRDDDHDGYGNICDAKFPGTAGSAVGNPDLAQFRASFGKSRTGDTCGTAGDLPCAIFDLDQGAATNIGNPDLAVFRKLFGKAPGPKCPTCPLTCDAGTAGTCGALP